MKKIIKYALFGMLFLLPFFAIKNVYAETYHGTIDEGSWISGVYIKKISASGQGRYQQGRFIRRSTDGAWVYCVQPFVSINNNYTYEVSDEDQAALLNMTEAQWNRIALLAYYGYGYGNHTAEKWYSITQVLIWRTAEPSADIYFTNTLNGTRNNSLFVDEINEIENLVANHYTRPSFNGKSDVNLVIGNSITLTDSNNVLANYKVTSTNNVVTSINGNNLTITATGVGEAKVNLFKQDTKYNMPPVVYFADNTQNVMRLGSFDPVPATVKGTVVGGKIEINKYDSNCNCKTPQGEATLTGAKYGIYDTSGVLIETLTTNDNAYAISGYLPSLGEYVVKEISPSKGYTLDKNTYKVLIDTNNLIANVDVYEKVINGNIDITKVMASAKTQIMIPEPNVKFGVYDSKNNLVKEVLTDKNGKFSINLPYGTYILKQLTTTRGFEYADDYKFIIDTDGKEIKEVISNAEITAKLKVVKIDSETKEVIKRSNIKFKIFDINNNEYVCQTVTAGQEIAGVGTTGYSTGPHLHYQVMLNGNEVDGMSLIDFTDDNYKPPFKELTPNNPYSLRHNNDHDLFLNK